MKPKSLTISDPKLLLLAFLEGIGVMTIEIGMGKILAAYFGNSYEIWAIIISITLLGLALGYYRGGVRAENKNPGYDLFKALLFAGTLIGLSTSAANSL